jgi:hypothetical protein
MFDRTSRLNAALAGRYRIQREGMTATVYLADGMRAA